MPAKKYSIAEARDRLPRLVHEAESGRAVELTRRGKLVAVIVSATEYARLGSARRRTFGEALDAFLKRYPPGSGDGVGVDFLRGIRDRTPPDREFSWC